ncbi:hypothetical protein [Hyphomonas sp.]|uniref:hypothetical protein n=1 Tax=Hyphomonas sp. TaxID=87 RepID=UPI0039194EBB
MTAAAAAKLPKAYEEKEAPRAPETPPHFIALEYAEPSPIMVGFQKVWRGFKRFVIVAAIVGAIVGYPAAIVLSSTIDDRTIVIPPEENWAVPSIAIAVHKIARELEGPGWASNRPAWHPQARLTALPAWQAGTAEALSQHVDLISRIALTDGAPDADLAIASRLLVEVDDEKMRPRLTAAAQALNRFDTRASRGLAMRPMPEEILPAELALFADWAAEDRAALSDLINAEQAGWPASQADIAAVYRAKSRAHIAHEMFTASKAKSYQLGETRLAVAAQRTQAAWARAAVMKPLLVSNQSDAATLTPNHLATMAFFLLEAEEASRHLAALMTPVEPEAGTTDTAALETSGAEDTARP